MIEEPLPDELPLFSIVRARHPAIAFPMTFSMTGLCSPNAKKIFGGQLSFVGALLQDDKRIMLIEDSAKTAEIKSEIMHRILTDPGFVRSCYDNFLIHRRRFLRFLRAEFRKKDLACLSNAQIRAILARFNRDYESINLFVVPFIYFAIDDLKSRLQEMIRPEDALLLEIPFMSYAERSETDYFSACTRVAKRLARRWGWVPFDYIGPDEWTPEFYLKRMGIDREQHQAQVARRKSLITTQNRLRRKYPSSTNRIISGFHILAKMQDERKAIATLSHTYLHKSLFSEISRRTGISLADLPVMTPYEIGQVLSGVLPYLPQIYSLRKKSGLIMFKNGRIYGIEGDHPIILQCKNALPFTKGLSGIGASPGTASGSVRICLSAKDSLKVCAGDILVAPMTTPDFLPAMKKAVGFITDEGGVTCHAAIIAREMGKPCVIGTHHATSALKEGDIVKIDGEKGTIEILGK